jgi:hypothetical protein
MHMTPRAGLPVLFPPKLLADGGGGSLKTDDSEMAPQVIEIAQNGLEEGGLIAA